MEQYLFVYGTLKEPRVQKKVLGRTVPGELNTLADYKKCSIQLGRRIYPAIRSEVGSSVEGLVIAVTPAELKQIDRYETDAYQRKKVTLTSGRQAWVYQEATPSA
jgi:gamma-glutamylcyclotransferase (GGCT)/AIG2-like uncharacterized protein YtfP